MSGTVTPIDVALEEAGRAAAAASEAAQKEADNVALVEEVLEKQSQRTTLSVADIVHLTDLAQQRECQVDAVKEWNEKNSEKKVSAALVSKYVKHKVDTGDYYVPRQRGPKPLLTDGEMEKVLNLTQRTRALGWPITAARFSALARGVTLKSRGSLSNVPGVEQFSASWAKTQMHKHGFRVRAATTSRTVTAKQVVEEGERWFQELEELRGVDPRLVFNVDEFFVRLEAEHRWTWERVERGAKDAVVVKDARLGFTASILSSLAGECPLLQLIWKGATSASHARVEAGDVNPKILQQHREKSHFQNADTFRTWMEVFVRHASGVREAVMNEAASRADDPPPPGPPPTARAEALAKLNSLLALQEQGVPHLGAAIEAAERAVPAADTGEAGSDNNNNNEPPAGFGPHLGSIVHLLIDAAPQHSVEALDLPAWLRLHQIPPSLTHVYQPADQFIISGIKQLSNVAYNRWISETVAQYSDEVAAAVLAGNAPPPGPTGGAPTWSKVAYKKSVKYRYGVSFHSLCLHTFLQVHEQST